MKRAPLRFDAGGKISIENIEKASSMERFQIPEKGYVNSATKVWGLGGN
jgi:hypothetical protein